MPAKPIPDGYEGATFYLCCNDATSALEFYKTAFGAKELMSMPMPDGKIGHAEIQIGGARIMLSDEFPDWGCLSPSSIGGSATSVMIYFEDVDAVAERAVSAGAKVLQPVTDPFYGDRSCKLQDPSGHTWMFATHKEDVAPDERRDALKRCSAEAKQDLKHVREIRRSDAPVFGNLLGDQSLR
jgi:PhnB protein